MKSAAEDKDGARRRGARTARIVLIAFAIIEAIVIFGVVVPALLKESPAGDRPHHATGASND
jgi:hypothetical protein